MTDFGRVTTQALSSSSLSVSASLRPPTAVPPLSPFARAGPQPNPPQTAVPPSLALPEQHPNLPPPPRVRFFSQDPKLHFNETKYGSVISAMSIPNLFMPFFGGLFLDSKGHKHGVILFLCLELIGASFYKYIMQGPSWWCGRLTCLHASPLRFLFYGTAANAAAAATAVTFVQPSDVVIPTSLTAFSCIPAPPLLCCCCRFSFNRCWCCC